MDRLKSVTSALLFATLTSPVAAEQSIPAPPTLTAVRSIGADSASTPAGRSVPVVLAGARAANFATIRGSVLGPAGTALATVPVRLRDARMGRNVATQITDTLGLFIFPSIDPGSYIVEVIARDQRDQRVLAASEIIHVGPGDTVSTIVRVPASRAPLGLLKPAAAAVAVSSAAAAAGVLTTTPSGDPVSPRQ